MKTDEYNGVAPEFDSDMEFEKQSSSPHISPVSDDQRKRWFSSTRASSLLDDQDDDEEEFGFHEPRLQRIMEGETSSDSSGSDQVEKPSIDINATPSEESPENEPGSPLVRFSENMSGMATFLCPVALGESSDDLQTYTSIALSTAKPFLERSVSETDSLQRLASSGPCGSSAVFDASDQDDNVNVRRKSSRNSPPPIKASGNDAACSDLDLLDFRRLLVSDISMLLGSSQGESWVTTVQNWLVEPPAAADTVIERRRIYNRCALRHGQSRRVRQLWFKWHGKPTSGGVECHTTGSTRSFDDIGVASENLAQNDVVDCFYDSDPESCVKLRTRSDKLRTFTDKKHRPAAIDTNASFGSTGHGDVPLPPKASNRNSAPSFESRSVSSRSLENESFDTYEKEDVQNFDLWDDQQVVHFVQHLTLGRRHSLVWHPGLRDCNSETPVSVQCWFEMGYRLPCLLVHPKFMWRETYLPDIDHRKLSASCQTPSSLDILSIVRVLIPPELDRSTFPFAKLDHTFIIKTNKGSDVFEAHSTKERDWFVHGLKLVIARLASMVIVGDDQMFLEFFTSSSHSPTMFLSQQRERSLSPDAMSKRCLKGDGSPSSRSSKSERNQRCSSGETGSRVGESKMSK